jgi:soluble lytic murein transglycosylase-like protein
MKIVLLIIIPLMIVSSALPTSAKISRRVHKDGTVEYYSEKEPAERPSGSRDVLSRFDGIIEKLSALHGVDPRLVKCIIKVESDFNPDAVSVAGAMGLMQIMQETADYYDLENPFNPEKNIECGVRHLKSLLAYFKNDVPLSLAAYHAGLGSVKKKMSLPPIRSTINYVNRVMHLYTGRANFSENAVKRLYKKIESDGSILIYSK